MRRIAAALYMLKRNPLSDTAVYLYIAGCGVYLLFCVQSLGLYSDDFWNLQASSTRSFGAYLHYHLSHVNSRYTYALFHRLLSSLFFDPADLFGVLYIRLAHALGVGMHLVSCVFVYRIAKQLGVRSAAVWAILPLIVFPVFGKQAVLWIGAYMAHVLGLMCFLFAVSATLHHRRVWWIISATLAVGASEFVLVPSLLLAGFYAQEERLRCGDPKSRACIRKTLVRCLPLLLPFVVYGATVLATGGMNRRINVLEQYTQTQLWTAPFTSIGRIFGHYLPILQPVPLFHDLPALLLIFFGGLMLLCYSKKEAARTSMLLGFLTAAIVPLAAVGYYTGGSRLRYIVGIFFYAAVAQALSAVMKRWDGARQRRLWEAAAVLFALGFTVWGAVRFHQFADDGRRAEACMQAVTLHLYDETDGRPPKQIEWCGASNKVDEFQVVNRSSLPYALALKYGTQEPIPIKQHKQCGEKRTPFFAPSACTNPIWYRIHSR